MSTLLEQALEIPDKGRRTHQISQEQIDLAAAWARGEITAKQVGRVTNQVGNSIYAWLALRLREYILRSDRSITRKRNEEEA